MGDITDICIGSVLKWYREGNPPSKDGNIKNSYFIFLGCYEEDNEWYVILVRTTSRIRYYTKGIRKNTMYVLFENHKCFERDSAAGDIDFYIDIEAERFKTAFENEYINHYCNIEKEKINSLQNILKQSPEILEFVKNKDIIDWLEYLIDVS